MANVCTSQPFPFCACLLLPFLALFSPQPTAASPIPQCEKFADLGFDLTQPEMFPLWFDDDSTMTLAQAGVYTGPDGIAEYTKFALDHSPYIKKSEFLGSNVYLRGWNETSSECVFVQMVLTEYSVNFGLGRFKGAFLIRADYRPADKKISRLILYYDIPYLEFVFGLLAGSSGAKNFVCRALRESCTSTWTANGMPTDEECAGKMDALPVADPFAFIDGNTMGCRLLHAVFADKNPDHCNHISFVPRADPKGRIKCQISKNIPHGYGFTDSDLFNFDGFKESAGINATQGYELVELSSGLTVLEKVLIAVGSTLFCACFGGILYSFAAYEYRMRSGWGLYKDLPSKTDISTTEDDDDCTNDSQELQRETPELGEDETQI